MKQNVKREREREVVGLVDIFPSTGEIGNPHVTRFFRPTDRAEKKAKKIKTR